MDLQCSWGENTGTQAIPMQGGIVSALYVTVVHRKGDLPLPKESITGGGIYVGLRIWQTGNEEEIKIPVKEKYKQEPETWVNEVYI